jgi:chromosomal replication initiation ATPase DnaA
MAEPRQLTIPLGFAPKVGRDDFLLGDANRAAFAFLDRWPDWPSPIAALDGPPGSGKSHLVRLWAEKAGAEILSGDGLADADVAAALGLGAVAVDPVDGENVPDLALFHLLNGAREAGASVLLASCAPVALWRVGLPDLASRLRSAAPLSLGAPDDILLRQIVVKLFADRQLEIDKAVVDYLLVRVERSLEAVAQVVEALDREALTQGRRVSRALAAQVLGRNGEQTEGA